MSIRVTGRQGRLICAVADVHQRTLGRWREGRARAVETKRIEDAIRALGWAKEFGLPFLGGADDVVAGSLASQKRVAERLAGPPNPDAYAAQLICRFGRKWCDRLKEEL